MGAVTALAYEGTEDSSIVSLELPDRWHNHISVESLSMEVVTRVDEWKETLEVVLQSAREQLRGSAQRKVRRKEEMAGESSSALAVTGPNQRQAQDDRWKHQEVVVKFLWPLGEHLSHPV